MKKDIVLKSAQMSAYVPQTCAPALEIKPGPALSLRADGVHCNGFGENNALTGRVRLHRAADRLSAEVETERTIPFGCEFAVERRLVLTPGFAVVTVDVRANNGGKIERLELDPVTFRGAWKRFAISDGTNWTWVDAPEETTVLYHAATAPVRILAESTDGHLVETGCGNDLWRHNAAGSMPGATGEFTVAANRRELTFSRAIFNFAPESEIPKRPWRLEYYVAWSCAEIQPASPAGTTVRLDELALPESARRTGGTGYCMTASATRRKLRELVRKATDSVMLTGWRAGICLDAGHLERPAKKELAHWDLDDAFALYVWGNGKIRSGTLAIEGADGAAGRVLAAMPGHWDAGQEA